MDAKTKQAQRPLRWFAALSAAVLAGAIASCSSLGDQASVDRSTDEPMSDSTAASATDSAVDRSNNSPDTLLVSDASAAQTKQHSRDLSSEWVAATDMDEEAQWSYVLNSSLGIAALNQLAIEGFISPLCEKSFYINQETGGFQSLMKVECPSPRGASTAVGYDEVHVIFNRFESNIEDFEIHRFGQT